MKTLLAAVAFAALPALASAQWPNHLPAGVPKTADGKPNLAAPAPRMPDGKPDLSGLWQNGPTGLGGAPSSDPNAPPAATFFNIGSNMKGSPLTDRAKITERIRRPNFGTLITDVTIDDPKACTKPFTVRFAQDLVADGELIEFICNENEQSSGHLLGKGEGPKTCNVSAQTFDRYVGRYRTAAGMEVAITRDGARFYGQMFGLPPFEIFASREREFFLTSFDARMTFQVDGAGRATALVLHMGDDQIATRVP